jgi:hypothetical protein
MSSRQERVMAVLWPSFLMAGVMEMLVFAFVDPGQLQLFGGQPIDWSPTAVYTVAFFLIWAVIAVAGALTGLLEVDAAELNRRSAG